MFDFIKIQYDLKIETKEWVKAQAPKWITQHQVNLILGGKNNEATI